MTTNSSPTTSTIEHFPTQRSTALTDELNRILTMVREVSPVGAPISFDFDGHLHVHIDVRKREEIALLESVLPSLGGGLFHSVSRGATPHHPFFHRVSALVAS